MIKRDIFFLNHILESCKYILDFMKDIEFETFKETRLIQSAVIRELGIIGEATKNLTNEIRNEYKDIPWKLIAGMKDVLTHGYFSVDLKEVWNTAKNDVIPLKNNVIEIISNKDQNISNKSLE